MDQPTEKSPEEVMKELCMAVISEMPSEVSAVQAGNLNVLNKLIGRVAKSSRGRADPRLARKVLEELLK
jgi:aspartyl-tRNA(Asn)/glutamyl-tRNA(Gln) amidotransferase subunit B